MSKLRPPQPRLTHFLCIPLVTSTSRPSLERAIRSFQAETSDAVPAKAVRPVDALHLTLGVMSLTSQTLQLAIETLHQLDMRAMLTTTAKSDETALMVDLEGLESMHDAADTSILYVAPKDGTDRLQPFCLAVQGIFKAKELLRADDRPLKLHATVVNTVYAKGTPWPSRRSARQPPDSSETISRSSSAGDGTGHGPKGKSRITLDARKLLDRYAEFSWAEKIVLDRLSICEMGAKKQFDEQGNLVAESYKEVAHIDLPP